MENVLRGEIYLAKFGKRVKTEDGKDTSVQYGFRPVLIVQNDKGNASSTTVIVAPMTSKLDKPSLPTHVFAKTDCGLRRNSIILMEQLSTIDQFRLKLELVVLVAAFYGLRRGEVLGLKWGALLGLLASVVVYVCPSYPCLKPPFGCFYLTLFRRFTQFVG